MGTLCFFIQVTFLQLYINNIKIFLPLVLDPVFENPWFLVQALLTKKHLLKIIHILLACCKYIFHFFHFILV